MKTILCFLLFSLIGWICLFLGIRNTRRYKARAAAENVRAEGVIEGYETKPMSWGRGRTTTAFYPIVAFTVDSRAYRATADYYYLPPLLEGDAERPPEGSGVVLYYNPANPFKFHLEQDRNARGEGYIRIGKYIIAIAAVVSLFCGLALKW